MTTFIRELSSLAALPEELKLAIIERLDVPSIISLRQTNKTFNRLCDPIDKSRHAELQTFLISAETFPHWQGHAFACFTCKKVMPRTSFTSLQLVNSSQKRTRFCIDCGVASGQYLPGSQIRKDGVVRVVCRQCKQLKGGRFCRRCALCKDCASWRRERHGPAPCDDIDIAPGHRIVNNWVPGKGVG